MQFAHSTGTMFIKAGIHTGFVEYMLAGENLNIILFIAFYADCTMIKVWICFLTTPFHCSGCLFAGDFLGCISKTTLVPAPGAFVYLIF